MKTGIYWQDPKYALRPGQGFIFDPSLVLYLPLHRLAGASFMSRDKHGHLCTVTGALWRPDGRSFDGEDDYIEMPDFAAYKELNGKDLSSFVWFRTSLDVNTNFRLLIGTYTTLTLGPPTPNQSWVLGYGHNSDPNQNVVLCNCRRDNAAETVNAEGTTQVNDGNWHYGGFVKRGLDIEAWVDGVKEDTASLTQDGNTDNNQKLRLGVTYARYLDALISLVMIYNRALTPLEIQRNYLAAKWRYQ